MKMNIIGIETSCDETSVGIINQNYEILSNIILTQEIHSKFGGVVPELASRNHIRYIVDIFQKALTEADLSISDIDLISVTNKPGLIGALLVGVSFAKAIAYANNIPLIDVDHLEGHIYASKLEHRDELKYPFLSLIISGGHTSIILVNEKCKYELIGNTIDDAAGEAFDKTAKLLNLSYPGGPIIDEIAKSGDPSKFNFPRALRRKGNFDFSFSGLKTSVKTFISSKSDIFIKQELPNILASFQEAVVSILIEKTFKVALKYKINQIVLGGGVAANSYLRHQFSERNLHNFRIYSPSKKLCTDNGAMIATAGLERSQVFGVSDFITLNASPTSSIFS